MQEQENIFFYDCEKNMQSQHFITFGLHPACHL